MTKYTWNKQEHAVTLQVACHVEDICRSFLKQNNLSYFSYVRAYDDGSVMWINNNADWYEHKWKKNYVMSAPYDLQLKEKISYCAFWKAHQDPNGKAHFNEQTIDAGQWFNINNPFSMVKRYLGYYEVFVYAAPKSNQTAPNFYINNIDLLDNFNRQFTHTAKDIINLAQENKIFIPQHMSSNLRGLTQHQLSEWQRKERHFVLDNHDVILTPQEHRCFRYVVKGYTSKMIAAQLGVSYRTVECYIAKIHHKLKINSRAELLRIVEINDWHKRLTQGSDEKLTL